MRPEQVAPTGVSSFYNENYVVDHTIVVVVQIQAGGNRIVGIDVIDSTFDKIELAKTVFSVVTLAIGVGGSVVGTIVTACKGILKTDD